MRACVIVFPGSNADAEMIAALAGAASTPPTVVWHTETALPADTDLVAIPGGFSYGDYLRCGALAKVSPIVPAIREHAAKGRLVLGVCNGFQILTEIGLLPGGLTRNRQMRFECGDRYIRVAARGAFTRTVGAVWRMPVAHAEGRYVASPELLEQLNGEDRVAVRYCDARGEVVDEANFNGSAESIAGIYGGPYRNILGLMPHPERAVDPRTGGADGVELFAAAVATLAGGKSTSALV